MTATLPIRWVGQRDASGCAAACIAMLTGRTYDEVVSELPSHSFRDDGMNEALIDAILAGWGYAVARRYVGRGAAYWLQPFGDMHLCFVDAQGQTHAVVMLHDGTVLDPNDPEPKRLTDYHSVYSVAAVVPVTSTWTAM